jgi:GTP-binding protein
MFSAMALEIEYLKSAVFAQDFPKANRPEIALAGRSNAGKSSFLNAISKRPVAKVSQEPGKTRLLNFFDVGKSYRIVDMPGYGFAKRAPAEKESWGRMIEDYLVHRETLAGLILVMDIKREWTADEELLADLMWSRTLPFCIVLTKADQLKRNEIENRIHKLQTQAGQDAIFAVSNVKKTGTDEVEDYLYKEWIKNFKRPVTGTPT